VIVNSAILNRVQIPNGKSLTRSGGENYAGEDSALCGNSKKSRERKTPRIRKERKSTRFLGSRWRSRRCRKNLESSRAHLGNLISDHGEFVSFTGTKAKGSRPFSQANTSSFENRDVQRRGG